MKRVIGIFLLFLACATSLIYVNSTNVAADTVESISYKDMVIRTAMANGEASTYLSLVDTTVKHGNVANNNINKFTTYTSSTQDWNGSLGTDGDNAYADDWTLKTKNNIGVILEIKANSNVNVTSTYAEIKGWIDHCSLNVYVKSSGNTTPLSSKTLSGATGNTTNTVNDFAVNVNLEEGDILYYEFISYADSYRNLQDVFALNFVFKQITEQLPTGAPTVSSETVLYSDIIFKTAENNGNIAKGKLVKYGLFYGNVSTTGLSLNKFSSYTADGNNNATLGTSDDDVYCPNAGQVYFGSKSGTSKAAIVKITALYDITLDAYRTINKTLGWTDQTILSVYTESNGRITELKNFELVNPTVDTFALTDVVLKAGDSLYYAFKYMYNDGYSRNAQDLGHFTFAFSYDAPHEHEYGDWNKQVDATCDTNGTLGHYVCSCGKYFDKEYNEIVDIVIPASHTYSSTYSSNETHHWYQATCNHNTEKTGYEEHSWDNGVLTVEPTPTVEGIKIYTCTVCNFEKTVNLGTSACEHTFSIEYTYDDNGHWNAATCGCDEIRNFSQHSLTWSTVEEGNYIVDKVEEGRCECGYSITKTTQSVIDFPDYSTLNSISLGDLAIYNAINEGQAISLANMTVNLRQGNVMSNHIIGFEKYLCNVSNNSAGEKSISVLIGANDEEEFLSDNSAGFSTWRMRTTFAKHAIFEIIATSDIKLDITHDAFNGGWIDEAKQFIGIYVRSGEKIYTISAKDIKENFGDANLYGGTLMLKEGDICYWVFGSNEALQRNVDMVPKFTANKDAYDEAKYQEQMVVGDETVAMWDALTATINNNYDAASYNLINFGFGYGTVKDTQKFNYHVGDGTGTAEDALWDSVSLGAGFLRWQIQCNYDADAIMILTAKENISLTVNHTASTWSNVWSTHTAVRYYVVDQDGTRVLVLDKNVESKVPEDFFTITVNLLEGQSLIIDYYTKNESYGSLDFAPVVTASCKSFDQSKVIDFSAVRALSAKILEAIETINTKFDEINRDDYSLSNWGKIENYYDEAIASLDAAQTEEDIANALNIFEENIENTNTKAEELAILNEVKAEALKELNDLVAGLKEDNYSSENWTKITDKLAEATKKINNATSQTSVNTLLASAKTYINNVKPLENKTTVGCGGSILTTGFMFVVLFAMVCFIRKKKLYSSK